MTPDVEEYVQTRLATLEKLLGDRASVAQCEVELGCDAGRERHGANKWFAEVMVRVPGEPTARATNHASTINAAIDDVKEEVERQLRRGKQVRIGMVRKSGAFIKRLMRRGE